MSASETLNKFCRQRQIWSKSKRISSPNLAKKRTLMMWKRLCRKLQTILNLEQRLRTSRGWSSLRLRGLRSNTCYKIRCMKRSEPTWINRGTITPSKMNLMKRLGSWNVSWMTPCTNYHPCLKPKLSLICPHQTILDYWNKLKTG